MKRVIPLGLTVTGLFLIACVIFPIANSLAQYFLISSPGLIDPTLVSIYPAPVVVNALDSVSDDYNQAENWFDTPVPLPSPKASPVAFFTLSLQRLHMQDIPVQINGSDLKKNAVHYPGTALPGDRGNTVVFGHSALPQFYRPNNPLTVFNPLLKANVGDEITIRYDGMTFRYLVRRINELKPSHVEVLAQDSSRRDLTLITCTPLGTYWYRFVIRAELVK
jgi:sortase A